MKKRRFKHNDRVRSVYTEHEPENIGTIKIENDEYFIVYDDKPETEYQILDDNYFEILVEIPTFNLTKDKFNYHFL